VSRQSLLRKPQIKVEASQIKFDIDQKKVDAAAESLYPNGMKKDEVLEKLAKLGKDRAWLAAESGYEFMSVTNKLGPSGSVSVRMLNAFKRVLMIEEARQTHTKSSASESAWDHVWFNGIETKRIMQAMVSGGYQKAEDLYHDAVIDFVDNLLGTDKTTNFELPFPSVPLLRAAAGIPILADAEHVEPDRDLGEGRFLLELRGDSMEPRFLHKQRLVLRDKSTLKRPLLKYEQFYCFIHNGAATFKQWAKDASGRKVLRSLNPNHPDIPADEATDWIGWMDEKDNLA